MVVRQTRFDVLISKVSCALCSRHGKYVMLNYSYIISLWNTNDFRYNSGGNSSQFPPQCTQRGHGGATNPSPSIHLSLSVMAETPDPQWRRPECPSASLSLPLTSRPSLSAPDLATSLRQPTGGWREPRVR